jgi:DNA polymerase-1
MGAGATDARIMLVGEAPGAREDEEHRAFVGASGQLLNKLLKGVGLSRRDCYITNVAKCRPPDNRTPERVEIKTCVQNYFMRELEMVDPDFILTLGNSALQGVVGKSGIRKHRGTVYTVDDLSILATYHPAAALRNPALLSEVEADFQRFARMVAGEETGLETTVKLVRKKAHLNWLLAHIIEADELTVDIETHTYGEYEEFDEPKKRRAGRNLEEWHGADSTIVSISFTWAPGASAVVPLHHDTTPWEDPAAVERVLIRALVRAVKGGTKLVNHNVKFDFRWLNTKGGVRLPQHFDTMLAAHMLDENRSKGLKPLSQLKLAADAYDVGDELGDAQTMPLHRLAVYNGKDTDYTMRLYHIFREELKREPRVARVFKLLMMPASNALTDIERVGIKVDMKRWAQRRTKTEQNVEKLREFMLRSVPKLKRAEFNFNSHPQIAEWLFNDLGLPILEETKKGNPSSNESVLLRLRHEHKAVEALLKYRKWKKFLSTYILPFGIKQDEGNRIHPTYRLFGTVTGRLSAEGAIQQVPRDTFIRGLFTEDEGWAFVEADYSQIELRIAAMLANERRMLRQFAAGEDVHMLRAMKMTGKLPQDVTKEERKKAKAVNFGYVYRMGAEKFVVYARDNYDVDMTLEEAEADRAGFFEDYPMLLKWHDRQVRLARRYRQVNSPIGRVRRLPDMESSDKSVRAEAERQAINSPVQSFASDLMLLSLVILHEHSRSRKDFRIIGSIHDALLFGVRLEALDEVLPLIRDVMEDMSVVRQKFGTDVTVPVEVELKVGTHWGEGELWTGD